MFKADQIASRTLAVAVERARSTEERNGTANAKLFEHFLAECATHLDASSSSKEVSAEFGLYRRQTIRRLLRPSSSTQSDGPLMSGSMFRRLATCLALIRASALSCASCVPGGRIGLLAIEWVATVAIGLLSFWLIVTVTVVMMALRFSA